MSLASESRLNSHNSFPWRLLVYDWLSLSLMLRPTVSRSVCLGMKHPSGAYGQIFYYCQTVAGLWMWGALSDDRTGLSLTIAPSSRQRSHFRFRVPWDSSPYFTVSNSRLPFSSSPTTRRVTVEVFDPASTRDLTESTLQGHLYSVSVFIVESSYPRKRSV
jgi:hypothetical protein